jgi:hypothetical protein
MAQNLSSQELVRRTIERRAIEAVIWGMPAVLCPASGRTGASTGHTRAETSALPVNPRCR